MYKLQNFDHILGTAGFSDDLLKNHFTLYQGYVTNTNKIITTLEALTKEGKVGTPEYAEVRRRLGWEFNGMRLHELYFGNMSKSVQSLKEDSDLFKRLVKIYGSYENWEKDFRAVGAMRGIGWVILYEDLTNGELFNVWVNEHDVGHLATCKPILIMDVFEHAFVLDYGLKRADYINAFFKAIDWKEVTARFK